VQNSKKKPQIIDVTMMTAALLTIDNAHASARHFRLVFACYPLQFYDLQL
jgi:hypothetical protein